MVIRHAVVVIASSHQDCDAVPNTMPGPPANPPPPIMKKTALGTPKTRSIRNSTMATPPRTSPDIARDLRREDRNRQAAQAHSDHMNKTSSETRMVPKSIPPSRKLIAMKGASPAKSVASFTACASSLPITTRRDESAVSVMSSSVCSSRSLRSALNVPSGTTARPSSVKQPISAAKVHRPDVPAPVSASAAPKNATANPASKLRPNE